jgi:hypothetical protein
LSYDNFNKVCFYYELLKLSKKQKCLIKINGCSNENDVHVKVKTKTLMWEKIKRQKK